MFKADSIEQLIEQLRPETPYFVLYQSRLEKQVQLFLQQFSGTTMYAVKCNSAEPVLQRIYDAGIRHFDVASIAEIRQIHRLFPDVHLHFMHPVKTVSTLIEAFAQFGVRSTVIDHIDEFDKILKAFNHPSVSCVPKSSIRILVRIKTPTHGSTGYDLSSKFGAEPDMAVSLLQTIHDAGFTTGIAFHVGSQCTTLSSYTDALHLVQQLIELAGVPIDAIDCGGGFPAAYAQTPKFDLCDFFETIHRGLVPILARFPHIHIFAEPGRSIVASAISLVTQVQLHKGQALYLNDGVYGSLAEVPLAHGSIALQGTAYRAENEGIRVLDGKSSLFTLFGPTCDSIDCIVNALHLPEQIATNDWIVFDQLGAYSHSLVNDFNGFKNQQFALLP